MKKSAGANRSLTENGTMPPATCPRKKTGTKAVPHALGSIPSSLILIDRALRVVSANRNFLEKARRSEADTIRAPIREIFPQRDPGVYALGGQSPRRLRHRAHARAGPR